jgi:PAS domain S-box-containing protein
MRLFRLAGPVLVVLGLALLCGRLLAGMAVRPDLTLAFVLLGVAAWRLRSGAEGIVTAGCGLAVVSLGSLALVQYVLGRAAEGMGPITAAALVLLGLAVLGLPYPRWVSAAQGAAVAAGYVGVLNFFGHAHRLAGRGHLSSPAAAYTEMAIPVAAGFVLAGVALLATRPRDGMVAIVLSAGAGGMMARRLLPATLLLPPALGWLRVVGERLGLWSFYQGWAVLALSTLALFVVIVWRIARALHQADTERDVAERALRLAHGQLEERVQQRTLDLQDAVGALEEEAVERRRAEQALRDSEGRYRALVESSRGLICSHDLAGTLLMVNPAAAAVLGYTADELVGTNLRALLAPSVRGLFPDYLAEIARVQLSEGIMRVVTRSGEERLWAYTNVRFEESGCPPYVLGHAHDITELKRVEALAREAAALRSVADLANAAAHEINNPLAIIAGQLELVRRKTEDPALVARIDTAAEAAQRISRIIAKMATITRLEHLPTSPSMPPLLDLHRSGGAAPATSDHEG